MKRHTAQWVLKAEEDTEAARSLAELPKPARDVVCFLCQQSAEKYLKAQLQQSGCVVPKTHDLQGLLKLLLPFDGTLAPFRRPLRSLTRYAVEYLYPGSRASTRAMQVALRHMERIRTAIRARLGLPP
jgi:HEPN domain-containing protein